MMRTMLLAAIAPALLGASAAHAGFVDELRVGVMQHDLDVLNNGAGGKESGFNITGGIVFSTPSFLEWAGSPEPFVNFSWNSDGGTNFGGFGMRWDGDFTERFFGEFATGYNIHDGVSELSPNPGDPNRIRLDATRTIFGSRDVFYSSLAAGVHVTEMWDAAVVFEHLSHGQILASGRNEGLDTIGLRLSYRLGE